MQAPVSMIKGMSGKGNTSLVLGLLVGLALLVTIKKAAASPQATKAPY
jgi:hypothetical protein